MKMSRRGFTRTEAVVGFVAMVVIGAIALLVLPTMGRTGRGNRGLTDQTQVRAIHQSMVLFAQNNQDRYPIPSELDTGHSTLSSTSAKDDPGSVLSILIYAGFIVPEITVSPGEQSYFVRVDDDYNLAYGTAKGGAAAGEASSQVLWDPGFRGSSAEQVEQGGVKAVGRLAEDSNITGNNSYAMMPFFGARREQWTNTFEASQAVLGNRGPTFDVVGTKLNASYRLAKTGAVNTNAGFTDTIGKGTSSISLLIHGGRTTWEGNVAFNDNSVQFLRQADPEEYPFAFSGLTASKKGKRRENFFVAENDATLTPLPTQIGRMRVGDSAAMNPLTMTNNWLRTWTVSGVGEDATTTEVTIVAD